MVLVEVAKHPNRAAQNPNMLKLSSVTEVRRIPPTMGTRDAQIRHSKYFLHTSHCNTTAQNTTRNKQSETLLRSKNIRQRSHLKPLTCSSWSEGLNGLHERNRNVSKTDIPQHYVDTEDERHREDPPPSILRLNHDQRFKLQDFDHNVSSNR